MQRSLIEGFVPDDWKIADVTPILKKGVKSDPGNYRPVSLTSQIGKAVLLSNEVKVTRYIT